jgi:hypothetical protein
VIFLPLRREVFCRRFTDSSSYNFQRWLSLRDVSSLAFPFSEGRIGNVGWRISTDLQILSYNSTDYRFAVKNAVGQGLYTSITLSFATTNTSAFLTFSKRYKPVKLPNAGRIN